MRRLPILLCVLLLGCPADVPPPRVVAIVADGTGRPEITDFMEVHVVRTRGHSEGEAWGVCHQEALVAWISSWQHLEIVDIEVIGPGGGGNLLILAKRKAK